MNFAQRKTLQSKLRHFIQTRVWGMDIHPTARIAATALIDRTWPRGIHIGEDCVISDEAVILAHDFTRTLYLDTWIGARTRLTHRSIILPGLTIGEDCLVMPGAVVTKNVPANSIVVGNPSIIRARPS
jgi:acetyltransferase-like isoleucine patch superfamily enzyme